jgi:uncharacterized protein (TIGR02145 family)
MKNIIRIAGVILIIILIQSCKKEVDHTIRDIDGNVYTSVTIGTQVWLVQNLKTTRYRNGDLIGTTTPATLEITAEATPKYQWAYDGNESKVATYGRLYTWYAVTDSRNVCPTGWHVPTDDEWTALTDYLGGESVAGGKLKEAGTTHWISPNTGATNESGFTALPGGYRGINNSFQGLGESSNWCSHYLQYGTTYMYYMGYNYRGLNRIEAHTEFGFSVRCVMDN